ncbi:MAG TPA: hypothetical protein VM737_01940 [Gemmatimonadota bacterium]|nr:hypothetical protein [Gemmatimonadota bacterium]
MRHFPAGAVLLWTAAVVLSAAAIGCIDDPDIIEPLMVTRIQLNSGDCGNLVVGGECTVVATAFDADGEEIPDARLFWSSENIVVATVTGQGVVSGHLAGTARITVETGNETVSASVNVLVREPPEVPI